MSGSQLYYGATIIHNEYGTQYSGNFPLGNDYQSGGVDFNSKNNTANQLTNNINQFNSCITQFSSSHIGSANCFIGYTPTEDLIFNIDQQRQANEKLIPLKL